jgi:ubiquinol-cytochrome c reductase cytochrome c subunit
MSTRLAITVGAGVALAVALTGVLAGGAPGATGAGSPRTPLAVYGDHLYGEYCLSCHGPNGKGQTHAAPNQTGAAPLRAQGQQSGMGPSLRGVGALAADFYLRTGYMPLRHVGLQPYRAPVFLSERQIRALVAYVASLGKGPPVPKPHPERGSLSQGLRLFTDHCAGCHQVVAKGGYVTGAVPPGLGQATPTQIAEAVRIGPYVMPTFSPKAISNRQLDSIIRYVEFTKNPTSPGGWRIGVIGPVPEGLVTWFIAAAALVGVCLLVGRRLHA